MQSVAKRWSTPRSGLGATAWVLIGAVHAEGGDVRTLASELVDELYDYAEGTVFFKPTLGLRKNTFRSTKQGAISYFVGGEGEKPGKRAEHKKCPDEPGEVEGRWDGGLEKAFNNSVTTARLL